MFHIPVLGGNIKKVAEDRNLLPECIVNLYHPPKETKMLTAVLSGAHGSLCRYIHDHDLVNGPGQDVLVIRDISLTLKNTRKKYNKTRTTFMNQRLSQRTRRKYHRKRYETSIL